MMYGKHLISGEWVGSEATFNNEPIDGAADVFSRGSTEHVNKAAHAAEEAFWSFGYSDRVDRANFLRKIADEIDARGDEITSIGARETGLPEARLVGERGRTVGQLRLFADHIEKGGYLDRRHDDALPDRQPLPRPDLKLIQRPIGPVAVFGASNFPLAFSVAGGDTASALAAGCPVIVKGHSAHPGTSEIVARAIEAAIKACDVHPGVFSLIQGGDRSVGSALVTHPLIKAVGFTGSLAGGRALYDLCASRSEPIPFFGELGSVNPMFVLPSALTNRGSQIASGWASSLTMGAGQFCTNPGIALIIGEEEATSFANASRKALSEVGEQKMLTASMAEAFKNGAKTLSGASEVTEVLATSCGERSAGPFLYQTTGASLLANELLQEEVFGPLGLVVSVTNLDEMVSIAKKIQGQLTCTLQLDEQDKDIAAQLLPILERKAGRILANGFPTGVEVCDSMVHGGPYPASTNFGATSVGTMAIRRFLRPVCYQNIAHDLLPDDLQ